MDTAMDVLHYIQQGLAIQGGTVVEIERVTRDRVRALVTSKDGSAVVTVEMTSPGYLDQHVSAWERGEFLAGPLSYG